MKEKNKYDSIMKELAANYDKQWLAILKERLEIHKRLKAKGRISFSGQKIGVA